MRTHPLFTLLLAALVALVIGCPKTSKETRKKESNPKPQTVDWKTQVDGVYPGTIANGPDTFPAKTSFKTQDGKITGKYELDYVGMTITGDLSEFTATADRKLKCRWIDEASREGDLTVTFSEDMSSFTGRWEPDDGDGNGAWTGKKQPPAASQPAEK